MRSQDRGLDSDLVLNSKAYDTAEAIEQSLSSAQPAEMDVDVDSESKSDDGETKVFSEKIADSEIADSEIADSQSDSDELRLPDPISDAASDADVMDVDGQFAELKLNLKLQLLTPQEFSGGRIALMAAQRADASSSLLILVLEDVGKTDPRITAAVREQAKHYRLHDGVLFHQWDSTKVRPRLSMQRYRTVIPRSMQSQLLREISRWCHWRAFGRSENVRVHRG